MDVTKHRFEFEANNRGLFRHLALEHGVHPPDHLYGGLDQGTWTWLDSLHQTAHRDDVQAPVNYFDRADEVASRMESVINGTHSDEEVADADVRFLIDAYREARRLNDGTLARIARIRELEDQVAQATSQLNAR